MTVAAVDYDHAQFVSREGHSCTVWDRFFAAVGETVLVELDSEEYPVRVATIAWESAE